MALWYPSVPAHDLHLNEEFLFGARRCTVGYEPLIWAQFGGHKGTDLPHLREIRLNSFGELDTIEFEYGQTSRPIHTITLGRAEMAGWCRTETLSVDGPGGEFIESVYASIDRARERIWGVSLHSLKVRHIPDNIPRHKANTTIQLVTNHGRFLLFEPEDPQTTLVPEITPLRPLQISPGTTITGFYITQVGLSSQCFGPVLFPSGANSKKQQRFEQSISRVGVISEVIEQVGDIE